MERQQQTNICNSAFVSSLLAGGALAVFKQDHAWQCLLQSRRHSARLSAVAGTDEYVHKLAAPKIVLMIIHEIIFSIKSESPLILTLTLEQSKDLTVRASGL